MGKKNGWSFSVAYVDNVAVRIHYMKGAGAPGGIGLRDDEIAAILQAEQGGGV